MDVNIDEFLWVEKYRPKKIADCILPEDLRKTFQEFVNQKNIPNLLFSGGPGMGKTTVAKAMCDEIGIDWMYLNCSKERGIDTLRTKISTYASAMSLMGGRKVIIMDEADGLTAETQNALKATIEEFANNCSFIFICNHKAKLIEPLHSRNPVIDFRIPASEKIDLAKAFMRRLKVILTAEGIQYEDKVIAGLIQKFFPDFRRTLGELQRHAAKGYIGIEALGKDIDATLKELMVALKEKDFPKARKWVTVNSDIDFAGMYRSIFDGLYTYMKPESIPQAILILADYQYKHAFVADPELNMIACLINIMADCDFV